METETATVRGRRTPEETRVIEWRAAELVRAGYSTFDADVISIHIEIDLHRAIELPQRGCPHDLALQILL
jgi:hypothetical protein